MCGLWGGPAFLFLPPNKDALLNIEVQSKRKKAVRSAARPSSSRSTLQHQSVGQRETVERESNYQQDQRGPSLLHGKKSRKGFPKRTTETPRVSAENIVLWIGYSTIRYLMAVVTLRMSNTAVDLRTKASRENLLICLCDVGSHWTLIQTTCSALLLYY